MAGFASDWLRQFLPLLVCTLFTEFNETYHWVESIFGNAIKCCNETYLIVTDQSLINYFKASTVARGWALGWFVGCGLKWHSAIFQLYSNGTDAQFPNFDLLPDTKRHGQLGFFSVLSLPRHGHRDVQRCLLPPYHQRVSRESNLDHPIDSPASLPLRRAWALGDPGTWHVGPLIARRWKMSWNVPVPVFG